MTETVPIKPTQAADRARLIRDRLPAGGLFADQHWRIAPRPFALGSELCDQLERLGRVLLQFYRAANLLYRKSAEGKLPAWAARWLDQGKPDSLIALQRHPAFKNALPAVIRPDLLLTDDGFRITELDSVPGGIGLTAWLNRSYEATRGAHEAPVLGGADGMQAGFRGIFTDAPRVHIVVAEESQMYRPELDWLAGELGRERFAVRDASFTGFHDGDAVYRFFELFDLANVPAAPRIFELATHGRLRLTPPPKPILEEKMLFALFWNRPLQDFWRQELGASFCEQLRARIPYTWIVDPVPLPPHAAIPGLDLTDWAQLKGLSQRERDLILKVSGYSAEAWGARGVHLGSDLSVADWSAAVDRALQNFPRSPYILQRYHKPRLVEAEHHDFERDETIRQPGRVRLCPYYFVTGDGDAARAKLGGVLATICPADKKIIHGMKDAILAPCCP